MNHPRMRMKFVLCFVPVLLLIFLPTPKAFADKAVATLEAPAVAARGEEITIVLTINHGANNFFHHVNWVEVWFNGQTPYRWEYSPFNLPEGATFTKETKMKVEGETEIKAEANCNIHGSKGPASIKVIVKE